MIQKNIVKNIHILTYYIYQRLHCQGLVQAIESDRRPVKLYGVLSDIRTLQLFFSSLLFSFIPRDRNGPADALAKACLCNKLISLGFGSI